MENLYLNAEDTEDGLVAPPFRELGPNALVQGFLCVLGRKGRGWLCVLCVNAFDLSVNAFDLAVRRRFTESRAYSVIIGPSGLNRGELCGVK